MTASVLKIYWQLLDWDKHPILIFYEEAKPQGFSQTFFASTKEWLCDRIKQRYVVALQQ
jgi:hypothetical protein